MCYAGASCIVEWGTYFACALSLHRLNICAFQLISVEEHDICLHPLILKGFNVDFDGDKMNVHVGLKGPYKDCDISYQIKEKTFSTIFV